MTREPHAFVTGYPGFIARRLVRKLLLANDALTMTVLIEAKEQARAEETLSQLAFHSGIDRTRIAPVVGDITAMDLGLSGLEFRAITEKATEIYHLAALHTLDADRTAADAVNVRGTANVLSFARAVAHLDRFVHFSSAYVSGDRRGVIMEHELEAGQSFRNAYEATKYHAEVLVRRAQQSLPTIVIRPAGVVGDSRTGEIDRFDSVYHIGMLLAGSPAAFPVPIAGEGCAPLNMIPVDYLIDAVHAIVQRPASIGRTFQVVDPNALSSRMVYEIIADRSGRKPPRYRVSPNLTKALLRIPGLERFAAVSHQAIDYLNHMAFYNSRNTMDVLEGTGIRCPHFEDYVDNLMQYVRDYFERQGARK
ncbi:MAG: SDR family oxidoreductase [Deltaproteobacteria bacterium]|nr:SDR family oxidoreductase [Deltaproteobacteria bacterium]